MADGGLKPHFDTVILAGGQAARMQGADKPALKVGGEPMLVSMARAAAAAGTRRLIVVGPERGGLVATALGEVAAGLPLGMITVRESPPGGGPVAALRRGLPEVGAPWLALLAADLPFLTSGWLAALLALAESATQAGAVLADDSGRPQWLAGCWNAERLRSALDGYSGGSLAGLLGPLNPALMRPPRPGGTAAAGPPPWLDCDDPAALATARAAIQDGAT
jgi:molybdopterin-guanine dinucleotide biosynthesis protein A